MTTEIITPRACVWDRIEKVLDEQDNQRKETDKLISDTFVSAAKKRKKMYIAAVAAIGFLGAVGYLVLTFL